MSLALAMRDRNRIYEFNIGDFTSSAVDRFIFTNLFVTGGEMCMTRVNSSSEVSREFLKITFVIVTICFGLIGQRLDLRG